MLTLAVIYGGSIFEVFILPSILQEKKMDTKNRVQLIIRTINIFSPIKFVVFAAIVFTGVFLLFSLHERISNISSSLYLNVFFIKILLVIIMFPIAAYQTFYLRFKILSINSDNIKDENLSKSFRIMKTCSLINIILVTIVFFLGIIMGNLT